ncbi:hypothetical protein F4X88_04160 [Candidatus Poribacteria bacterium]|nr:hypothetical protein [Candidatus Poribacteria bacterium]
MSKIKSIDLPLNWQTVKFGDVATFTKKPKDLRYSDYNEVPFVPMNLVPIATLFSKEFIRKPSDKISSGTYFEPGDILLAKITPSFENGKQCIIQELPTPFGIATTEVIPIREVEGVSDKFYLFNYLLLPDVRSLLTERMQGTTGRLRLGTKTLAELEIPLPPLAEQLRIVAKIEALFTQLDAAIDSLKKAHAQLQRYRRSILKSAFEGELTREWREGYSGELEPMSVSEVSTQEGLSELPEGWEWTTLANCAEILDSQRIPINAKERETRISGKSESELYPYYGATGRVGWIDDYLFDEELVLLGEDGAPFLDFLKDTAYLIRDKSWVNNHAHVLRAKSEVTSNQFLCHYLNTFDYHGYLTGTTRLKLNQSAMRKIPVPLPPLPEQKQVVSELERNLSVADEIEVTIKSELERSEGLRQSILKQAFSGKLVSQDPSDEPASVLLEKIRAEKKQQQPKRGKKTTKSKTQNSDNYPLLIPFLIDDFS